jgi:hypothetical protein
MLLASSLNKLLKKHSYSKVSRLLPDKYKDKQKQKAALLSVEKRRSTAYNMQANDNKNTIEESETDKQFRNSALYQHMNNEINRLQSDLQQFHQAKYLIDCDALKDMLQTIHTKHSEEWYLESQFVECQFVERVKYDKDKSIIFLGLSKKKRDKDLQNNVEEMVT